MKPSSHESGSRLSQRLSAHARECDGREHAVMQRHRALRMEYWHELTKLTNVFVRDHHVTHDHASSEAHDAIHAASHPDDPSLPENVRRSNIAAQRKLYRERQNRAAQIFASEEESEAA